MNKGKILLVEDEFVVAENIRSELEAMNYQITGLACSGEEAVELARKDKPDLALMDIKLRGDMDGIEAATILRQKLDVPALFLTAFADERFLERAKAADPLGYMVKPYERKGFRAGIEMAHYKARMERLLKESESRFRSMFDNAPVAYAALDEHHRLVDCNTQFCRLLGFGCSELMNRRFIELCPPQTRPLYEEQFAASKDFGSLEIELELTDRDGKLLTVLLDGRVQRDQHGAFLRMHCILHNITERKRAEEERIQMEQRLHQARKAECMARMAGAIAHNFNNMLAVVQGNLELALDDAPRGSELKTFLDEAKTASQQAAEISRFMLTSLGQTELKVKPLDFSKAIREACGLLNVSIPAGVRLRTDLPSPGPVVQMDGAHLKQILTNLMSNAVEAIGEREGEIEIGAHVVADAEVRQARVIPFDWQPRAKRYACLSVADNGHGMDKDTLDLIFDPFFTTQFQGRGLGLSVVLGLVRAYEGAVAVESAMGRGAKFRVFLPVPEQTELSSLRGAALGANTDEGARLALVIDDEAMVRNMVESMLKRKFGYEVLMAEDGPEALRLFNDFKEEIELVILDLSMPGMNGWEVLSALRALRPDAPVILTSGYDEARALSFRSSEERPQAFLQKPFGMNELKATIVQVLQDCCEKTETGI